MLFNDSLVNVFPYFWIFLGLFFLLFEAGTPGLFYFLSFSIASWATAIGSFWITSIVSQLILFITMTIVAIAILRAWLKTNSVYLKSNVTYTNMDALRGKVGLVVTPITFMVPGQVKVNGEVWLAKSFDKSEIESGMQVKIRDVVGAHLVVSSLTNEKQ